ncbi:MAG: peptidylprolyl isomerase [Gammaproteobacteria bacterium]|nr:peptidylprolyl isomerase [Gammaproteobacteria bacterium]
MKISANKVVTINYVLKDTEGNVLDTASDGSFAYLHGSNNIIPGLENALQQRQAGETLSVLIPAEQAYGLRDERLQQTVPREMFGDIDALEHGMQFHAESPDGEMVVVTVVDISGDEVTVDGNHPFADLALNFDVEIVAVRDASAEELSHGHVHGAGGHHH